jgi:hypothetical protein
MLQDLQALEDTSVQLQEVKRYRQETTSFLTVLLRLFPKLYDVSKL